MAQKTFFYESPFESKDGSYVSIFEFNGSMADICVHTGFIDGNNEMVIVGFTYYSRTKFPIFVDLSGSGDSEDYGFGAVAAIIQEAF